MDQHHPDMMRRTRQREAREAARPERERMLVRFARDDIHRAIEAEHPQADWLMGVIYLDASETLFRAVIMAAGEECSAWLNGADERAWLNACDAVKERDE